MEILKYVSEANLKIEGEHFRIFFSCVRSSSVIIKKKKNFLSLRICFFDEKPLLTIDDISESYNRNDRQT